jgi:SAM-dependent methyltransferase
MARLGSQAKAGFYPTPESVRGRLKALLDIEDGARILDPCCGQGQTLAALAEETSAITYGIELDHDRATEARQRIDHLLWGDALVEMRISPAAFGLLMLNPPYDYSLEPEAQAQRLEALFLRRFQETLHKDGWLVLVVPYTVLAVCAPILARHFTDLQVYAFPEEEFHTFHQCLVLGRKRSLANKAKAAQMEQELNCIAGMEPEIFLATAPQLTICTQRLVIPAPKHPCTFQCSRIDPREAIPLVRKSGLLEDLLTHDLAPGQCHSIRPLAPLKNGHLALMLAGGYMNGEIEMDGHRLVIKGMVHKTEKIHSIAENNSGDTMVTTRDLYQPTVKAIDMTKVEMLIIR